MRASPLKHRTVPTYEESGRSAKTKETAKTARRSNMEKNLLGKWESCKKL
jgi:hypothetical protein